MTLRHDHRGEALVLSIPQLNLKGEEEMAPLPLGTELTLNGRKGFLTGACAPHEAGAPGCVFITFEDAPLDERGVPIATEYTPEQIGVVWIAAA